MDMTIRPRRLRGGETIRKMVRETRMDKSSLIYPLFVMEGENLKEEIPTMPGQFRYSLDRMPEKLEELKKAGVDKVMFFGIPDHKDEVGSQAYAEDGIVQGTGPYKAVSLTADTGVVLEKNVEYWNGDPKIDQITVRTISDGDTLTMALQSGEIDAAYGLPYASYPLFENDRYTFTGCATSRVFFGAMNFESEITGGPAVRKAIAMGIDKEGFVETLLGGNGYPAAGVYPDSFSFGGDAVTAETYDPEGAKAVLEEAGWTHTDGDGVREKDGTPLVLRWLTYPSRQELPLLAESAQATLGEIGFQVEINSTANHNSIRADRTAWDVYFSAMVTAPTGDPEYFFTYHCLDSSDSNDGHYHSDKLEQLAQEMSQTFDTDRRGELAVEMQQTILDDNAYVFCSHLRMSMAARAGVTGLAAHPCDYYEITADLDVEQE